MVPPIAGTPPSGAGTWLDRDTLVRKFASHLVASGSPVTIAAIRDMLRFVDRGYSLRTDQISRALAPLYASQKVARYPNGAPVLVDGDEYPSIRAAAEAKRISPQTVINRIASDSPQWTGWQRVETRSAVLSAVSVSLHET